MKLKTFDEFFEECCAEDPGMRARVEKYGEELDVQEMLYFAREAAGLTQQEVAERMHTNRSFISRLETRPQNMKLSTLRRYSKAVGRTLKVEMA